MSDEEERAELDALGPDPYAGASEDYEPLDYRQGEELAAFLQDMFEAEHRALVTIADLSPDPEDADKADTTLAFLIWVRDRWQELLVRDRATKVRSPELLAIEEVAWRMAAIWGRR